MLFVIFVLVCDVSVVCTCTVLLHILSGSVWVCNLWSARLWECNAHDWLTDCVVGQNRLHLHLSPMMSHAHSSSSSCLHMSIPSLSSLSSTSTPHSACCRSVEPCEDPQNEECGPVANTTSSTEQKDKCSKGNACSSFARRQEAWTESTAIPPDTKWRRKTFERMYHQRRQSFREERCKERAEIVLKECVRDYWHLSVCHKLQVRIGVQINSAKGAYSGPLRCWQSPQRKSRRKVVEKDLLLDWKNSNQLSCASHDF